MFNNIKNLDYERPEFLRATSMTSVPEAEPYLMASQKHELERQSSEQIDTCLSFCLEEDSMPLNTKVFCDDEFQISEICVEDRLTFAREIPCILGQANKRFGFNDDSFDPVRGERLELDDLANLDDLFHSKPVEEFNEASIEFNMAPLADEEAEIYRNERSECCESINGSEKSNLDSTLSYDNHLEAPFGQKCFDSMMDLDNSKFSIISDVKPRAQNTCTLPTV